MASRARVLEAARSLFEEVGFQGATVRLIAERARLSPAGVFTTFDDKVAILCHIVGEHRERLFEELARTVQSLKGSARDRILRIVATIYADEFPRLPMVAAYLGASYGWSQTAEDEHRRLHAGLCEVITDILRDGASKGEIADHVDLALMRELICGAFHQNYRLALTAGMGEAELNARTSQQIELVFDGARPRGEAVAQPA
jgi:AcrR family transcriptional regulator